MYVIVIKILNYVCKYVLPRNSFNNYKRKSSLVTCKKRKTEFKLILYFIDVLDLKRVGKSQS